MISPETIEKIKQLMDEASVYEDDLEESFIMGGCARRHRRGNPDGSQTRQSQACPAFVI